MSARAVVVTRSGKFFDLRAPVAADVDLRDIAHALAHLCRFTGHVQRFYSVAEHSVHASHIVPAQHALAALLHDAPEAYIGDVSRPLKSCLPDYRRIEAAVERAVLGRFGLTAPLAREVHLADMRLLRAEMDQAMGQPGAWAEGGGLAAADVTLQFWPPDRAARAFLARFDALTGAAA